VRLSGFEPPRYCYRQPLKLVRLPVPPQPRSRYPLTFELASQARSRQQRMPKCDTPKHHGQLRFDELKPRWSCRPGRTWQRTVTNARFHIGGNQFLFCRIFLRASTTHARKPVNLNSRASTPYASRIGFHRMAWKLRKVMTDRLSQVGCTLMGQRPAKSGS
jgi:hypothetical protein